MTNMRKNPHGKLLLLITNCILVCLSTQVWADPHAKHKAIMNIAKVDPADVSGSDSDCPEENVEEVNKPSTSRGRVCGCGRKLRCGSGGGMG